MNELNLSGTTLRQRSGFETPLLPSIQETKTEEPVLKHYLRIAVRRRRTLIGAVLVAVIVGLLVTLLTTPQYTATSTIEISRESNRIVNIQSIEPEARGVDLEFYQTQYGLLRSRSLAESVARQLGFDRDRAFLDMFDVAEADELFRGNGPSSEQRAARLRKAGQVLLDNLDISPVRGSRLVNISFTSPDEKLSARVANAWAQRFIQANLERKFDASAYARSFLENRLEQTRQRLEASERALVQYAQNQRIINLPPTVGGGRDVGERSLTADELSYINQSLAAATAARIEAQARWQEATRGNAGAAPEALTNNAITTLRRDRAQLSGEYSRLLEQFEPGYPAVRALQSQIAQLDRSIAREENRVQSSLSRGYQEALVREKTLSAQVDKLKSGLLDLRRRSIQYNIYQRDADTNRQLYDALLQRYKEIGVTGGIGTNNIAIVDQAKVPEKPSRPRVVPNMAIALVLGLALGIALILALEQIDDGISDPSDVERELRVPLLGAVPKLKEGDPSEVIKDPKSAMVDSMLSIEANLRFSTESGLPRAVAITSSRAAEGKSTTAHALALGLSRSGARTVLVDADMRSPSIHNVLSLSNTRGLSNYLSGEDNLHSLVQTVEQTMLSVVPAGPPPPNAAILLSGDRLSTLIQLLSKEYDHIIIDAPPVLGLADSPLIASNVGGVVFVVEAHETGKELIKGALGRLSAANARVLGVVLMKLDERRTDYGYGYGYGYGLDYGSKAGETA